ncbi:hypothetical protein HDU76_001675, partial [Blyttiomyces sp. JEL0837]
MVEKSVGENGYHVLCRIEAAYVLARLYNMKGDRNPFTPKPGQPQTFLDSHTIATILQESLTILSFFMQKLSSISTITIQQIISQSMQTPSEYITLSKAISRNHYKIRFLLEAINQDHHIIAKCKCNKWKLIDILGKSRRSNALNALQAINDLYTSTSETTTGSDRVDSIQNTINVIETTLKLLSTSTNDLITSATLSNNFLHILTPSPPPSPTPNTNNAQPKTSITSLPIELLTQIALQIQKTYITKQKTCVKTLAECTTISRQFHSAFNPILWSTPIPLSKIRTQLLFAMYASVPSYIHSQHHDQNQQQQQEAILGAQVTKRLEVRWYRRGFNTWILLHIVKSCFKVSDLLIHRGDNEDMEDPMSVYDQRSFFDNVLGGLKWLTKLELYQFSYHDLSRTGYGDLDNGDGESGDDEMVVYEPGLINEYCQDGILIDVDSEGANTIRRLEKLEVYGVRWFWKSLISSISVLSKYSGTSSATPTPTTISTIKNKLKSFRIGYEQPSPNYELQQISPYLGGLEQLEIMRINSDMDVEWLVKPSVTTLTSLTIRTRFDNNGNFKLCDLNWFKNVLVSSRNLVELNLSLWNDNGDGSGGIIGIQVFDMLGSGIDCVFNLKVLKLGEVWVGEDGGNGGGGNEELVGCGKTMLSRMILRHSGSLRVLELEGNRDGVYSSRMLYEISVSDLVLDALSCCVGLEFVEFDTLKYNVDDEGRDRERERELIHVAGLGKMLEGCCKLEMSEWLRFVCEECIDLGGVGFHLVEEGFRRLEREEGERERIDEDNINQDTTSSSSTTPMQSQPQPPPPDITPGGGGMNRSAPSPVPSASTTLAGAASIDAGTPAHVIHKEPSNSSMSSASTTIITTVNTAPGVPQQSSSSSSGPSTLNTQQPSVVSTSGSTIPKKVYIGLAPLTNPGWLTYIPVSSQIPHHSGYSAFVLIVWGREITTYQVLSSSYSDPYHTKPFERLIESTPVNPSSTTEEKIQTWLSTRPQPTETSSAKSNPASTTTSIDPKIELREVGVTTKSPEEATDYAKNWRKGLLKYHSFWDNNSGFVDALANFIITEDTWRLNLVAPMSPSLGKDGGSGGTGSGVGRGHHFHHHHHHHHQRVSSTGGSVSPNLGKQSIVAGSNVYDTPLGYVIWRKKHANDGYWKNKDELNAARDALRNIQYSNLNNNNSNTSGTSLTAPSNASLPNNQTQQLNQYQRNRRDSTAYSISMNDDGRLDVQIESGIDDDDYDFDRQSSSSSSVSSISLSSLAIPELNVGNTPSAANVPPPSVHIEMEGGDIAGGVGVGGQILPPGSPGVSGASPPPKAPAATTTSPTTAIINNNQQTPATINQFLNEAGYRTVPKLRIVIHI